MRKILMLAMAVVFSLSSALATTVYCKMTQSWWTADGAAVGVHYWGGTSAGPSWPGFRMSPVAGEEGLWSYDVPSDITGIIFTRVNPSGDVADWGAKTGDLTLPADGKNLYTITSTTAVWSAPCAGEWSTYTPTPPVVTKVTYTALTAAPSTGNWAGQYLIVWGDNKAHATVTSSNFVATSDELTITSGKIEINSDQEYYVKVEPFADGYSIELPNGKYLGMNANSNAVAELAKPDTLYFEYSASGVQITGKDTQRNTRYLVNNGTFYRGYKEIGSYPLPTLYRTGDEAPALQTVYFVNSLDWTTVNAFVWPETGSAYKAWPGEAMYKTGDKINGKDVYAYRFPASYTNIIFNNGEGAGSSQTVDLKWAAAKPYFLPGDKKNGEGKYEGSWYASKAEIPTTKYYIIGSMNGWDKKTPIEMTPGNGDSLSVDIPLIGDYHYEFKVLKVLGTDTAWLGDQYGGIMDKSNCKGWTISKDYDQNIGLQTTKEANYKFIFDKGKVQISVVIPEGGTVVPETATALLKGVFSIAANGTAKFSRGNLQYNQGAKKWYFAEKQYDMIAEKNIHLGNENYSGSIDLFSWNCATAENGIKLSNKDADFTGAFVDWTGLFAGDIKYSTLSKAEWDYLMARKKDGKALWTMAGLGPDSIIGLILFPDDWTAPTGIAIEYGIPSLSVKVEWPHRDIPKHNLYTFEQWATLEAAGAVFLPAGGERAGYWGNKIGFNGVDENTNPASWNPEANNTYSWAENANEYGMYWLSTQGISKEHYAYYVILPAWSDGPDTSTSDDDFYYNPAVWQREKRRGNSVRLVEKTYLPEYYIAGSMTEWADEMVEMTPGNKDTLTVDINLDEMANEEFKVVKVVNGDTTWYGLEVKEGQSYDPMVYGNSTGWYLKAAADGGNKNVKLETTQKGTYKFIFEKNENNMISVVMPEPLPIDSAWYVAGAFTNWATDMVQLLGEKKDSLVAKINLTSDDYTEFKLVRVCTQGAVKDTAWFGLNETATMVEGNSKNWFVYLSEPAIGKNNANVGLQPTKAGEYTFVVNPLNKAVTDELAPAVTVLIPASDKVELKLVPNMWADAEAKIAAWAWSKDGKYEGWTEFFAGSGDTLSTKLNAKADSIIFVRFSDKVAAPVWDDALIWNRIAKDTVDNGLVYTVYDWTKGTWDKYEVKYYIAGDFTDWAEHMVELLPGNADSLLVDINLDEMAEHTFKVVKIALKDTTWYGLEVKDGQSYDPMVYGNSTAWYLKAAADGGNKDIKLQTTQDGAYKFIFEKNDNNEISVVMPEPLPIDSAWYVAGAFTNWATDMVQLTGEKKDSLVAKFNLTSDDLTEFKLVRICTQGAVKDTAWFGLNETATMVEGNSKNWFVYLSEPEIGKNNANVGLQPTKAGEYTFVVNPLNKAVTDELAPAVTVLMPASDKVELKLVPNMWADSEAKMAAWAWSKDRKYEGWTEFFAGSGDTLSTMLNAKADSIIFVRFNATATDPVWGDDALIWNQIEKDTVDNGLTYTITNWTTGTWEVYVKVYSVAGAEDLLGSKWNEKEGNEMTKQADGSYKLVKENVVLAKGDYEYKVVIDHKWNNGEAKDNSKLSITESGKYDVTFTYVPGPEPVTSAVAQLIEPIVVVPKIQIAGTINSDWTPVDLTVADDQKSASFKVTLAVNAYLFKMVLNSNWLGDGTTFTRTNYQLAGLNTNTDNMALVADAAGEYVFTWTFANDSLSITYPELPYGIMTNDNQFYPAQLNPANPAELMALNVPLNAQQTFQLYDNANHKGWTISNFNEGSYVFPIESGAYTVTESAQYDFYVYTTLDGVNNYIYVAQHDKVPTGCENIEVGVELRKVIENGTMYIYRDGKKYSVQGYLVR